MCRPGSRTEINASGGAEAGLARIETLKASSSSSEAPKAPTIEMPKASRGELGGGVPSPAD